MFEGKLPRKGDARPLGDERDEGEFLRELTWADVTARLGIFRGRIEAGEPPHEEADASFDATCARRIAAHHNGKPTVNLNGSNYGKVAERTGSERMKGTGGTAGPRGSR